MEFFELQNARRLRLRGFYDDVPVHWGEAAVTEFLAVCIAIPPVIKVVGRRAASGFPAIAHFKQPVLSDFPSIIAVCHVPEDRRVVWPPPNGKTVKQSTGPLRETPKLSCTTWPV
jgi:hypothetical protein